MKRAGGRFCWVCSRRRPNEQFSGKATLNVSAASASSETATSAAPSSPLRRRQCLRRLRERPGWIEVGLPEILASLLSADRHRKLFRFRDFRRVGQIAVDRIATSHRDLREATRKKAESTPRRLETRLTKGEKPNRKPMAEVATVYSIGEWPRTIAAEAVLRLRALRASNDFDDYWQFHIAKEHERTHQSRYADGEVPNPLPPKRPHLRLVK